MTLRSATPMRFYAVLILLPVLSCGGGGSSGATGGGGTPPPATCQDPLPDRLISPRFSTDLLPVFQATCGGSQNAQSCHGTLSLPAGKFSFYTEGSVRTALHVHSDLVNVPPNNAPVGQGWMRIKPNDVSRSWLIEKLSSDQPGGLGYGARMPAGGQNICSMTLENLKTWIQNGAPL